MGRILFTILAVAMILIFFIHTNKWADADDGRSQETHRLCQERCSSISGLDRYRCIRICISSYERAREQHGSSVKERIRQCEDICRPYSGLDNVKCLRICLEKNTGEKSDAVTDPSKTDRTCQDRCALLDGADQYRCLKKCREQRAVEEKDPTRFNR